jgi:hypothetical protein
MGGAASDIPLSSLDSWFKDQVTGSHVFFEMPPSPFGSRFLQLNHENLPWRFVRHMKRAAFPKRNNCSSVILRSRVRRSSKSISSLRAKRYMRSCPKSGLAYYIENELKPRKEQKKDGALIKMIALCEPTTFWSGPAADWAVAVGTVILAFVAVFQQWLQRLIVRPRLAMHVRLARPDAEKTSFNDGTSVYYFRLAVENVGNAAAHDVQVYVSEIKKKKPDDKYASVERFMPMALIWAHTGQSTKPSLLPDMPPAFCDFGHISDPERRRYIGEDLPDVAVNETVLALDLEVKPFSKGHLLGPGTYRVHLKLAASDCKPRDYVLRVTVTGSWSPYEDKMFGEGIGIGIT